MCEHKQQSPPEETAKAGLSQQILDLIPNHPACKEALNIAQTSLPASIFYHSVRIFLYTQAIFATTKNVSPEELSPIPATPVEQHIVFVACMFHDLGTTSTYDEAPERFEVCGADAAVRLLRKHQVDETSIREAWLAITLHTSAAIAERMSGLVRALRLAVRADFSMYPVPDLEVFGTELASQSGWDMVKAELPRLDVGKDLTSAIIEQGLRRPEKVPDNSWAGGLVRAKKADPNWHW
ncbi:hypothetical protein GE09DRAFT_978476 [Coniochaeta sp. 2T2.1]|nr:hypothetical protein GE09DRAFT_978476 [Coniochaeta sp. 2T2.1]